MSGVGQGAGKLQVVVAGSGKMARDVGIHFLSHGHPVAWLSRDQERLEALERWVRRRARRISKYSDVGDAGLGRASFALVGGGDIPRAEIFIECINELAEEKRALMRALEPAIPDDAIRLSNSSSISPEALHRECAGLHFFYPVELTGFVEAVFPEGFSSERRQRLLDVLAETQLECIEEDSDAAFAVNRLLLPLQSEALRLVMGGVDRELVDEVSSSDLLPLGQLTLMDTIGLDVVCPAAINYTERLGEAEARLYEPLIRGLSRCLELEKRGRKNRDGLMVGAPLPWPVSEVEPSRAELSERFRALFLNTCQHALELGLLKDDQLDMALASLFGLTQSLHESLTPMTPSSLGEVLARAYDATGLLYFIPCRAWRGGEKSDREWPIHGPLI